MTTSFLLPTAVTYNGTGVNGWANPDNILLVDNEYAVSTGATCVLQVGNFTLSITQDSNITNFTIRIKWYRGSFNTTLQLYAIDNTTGVELSYPAAPFQSFSGTNTLFTLPSTLFGTTWTVDQANNIQIKLIADGELHGREIRWRTRRLRCRQGREWAVRRRFAWKPPNAKDRYDRQRAYRHGGSP